MKEILLVESDINFYNIYVLNLKTYLGCQVVIAQSLDQAIKNLESKKFDLILCRTKFLGDEIAKTILEKLSLNKDQTPMVSLGSSSDEISSSNYTQLSNGIKLKDIIKACADSLDITAVMMAKLKVNDYYPIPIHYFAQINESILNIYTEHSEGFEIIVPQFTDIDSTMIEKLQIDGTDNWFVKKEDRLKMVNYITSSMIAKIDFNTLDEDDQMGAQEVAQKLVSIKLSDFGVREETVKLSKMAIRSMANNIIKTKKIGGLIQRLKSNKASYLFKHVQLTTFFGFHILQNIDWGTKEQMEKLAFTAFFHDIALINDKQASIHSNDDLRKAQFDQKEKELVNKHAQIAAGFINQMPNAPMGVDQIVRQHHGTLNGIGFSDHYSTNISPLATVFMLSEETAKILLSAIDNDSPLDYLISKLKEKFTTARFKKYIEILGQVQY